MRTFGIKGGPGPASSERPWVFAILVVLALFAMLIIGQFSTGVYS